MSMAVALVLNMKKRKLTGMPLRARTQNDVLAPPLNPNVRTATHTVPIPDTSIWGSAQEDQFETGWPMARERMVTLPARPKNKSVFGFEMRYE